MKGRVVLSGVAVAAFAALNWLLNVASPVISANLAGKQFDDSNTSYAVSRLAEFFNGSGLPVAILLLVLVAIWYGQGKSWYKKYTAGTLAAVLFMLGLAAPAHAYYDKTDWPEIYTILPNESAFFIPDVGANKTDQTKFDSQSYLESNKIAAKRFMIPHQKLQGSGNFFDFYVPSGRLIIVDRTPYSREWVAAADRGTSKNNESFPCQSAEGLNITVGMSIGAYVTETDAAKFLYNFGVVAPAVQDRKDPQVIFASVYSGRSLTQVMDDVGRKKVQTLVCDEIGKRTFDQANKDMVLILKTVTDAATTYFAGQGITLSFLGYADTWGFDKDVQDAINRRYAAQQDAVAAQMLQPYADTIQKVATARALAVFAEKFNGHLPNAVVIPPDVLSAMLGVSAPKGLKVPAQDTGK